jgi:arylsulfatase A-like enzyme
MNPVFLAVAALAATPPNLLLICIDDLGYTDVSFQGAEYETPNIDALALGGLRLEQFYVQPSCTPTRASLLTGLFLATAFLFFF